MPETKTIEFKEQLRLAAIMSFIAGSVNVTSFLAFYVFSSNVTGYYAILGAEIAEGNFYQLFIIFTWIFLFLGGSFVSSFLVHSVINKNNTLAHCLPIVIETICLLGVGYYGMNYYSETLTETEILVAILLFAMGIQNGYTSSISKFTVKTTHLTGATTDLGVLLAMLAMQQYKHDSGLIKKVKLLGMTALCYLCGSMLSGLLYYHINIQVLYCTSFLLTLSIAYNFLRAYKTGAKRLENYYSQPI